LWSRQLEQGFTKFTAIFRPTAYQEACNRVPYSQKYTFILLEQENPTGQAEELHDILQLLMQDQVFTKGIIKENKGKLIVLSPEKQAHDTSGLITT
jgi:hypothetical protein